MKNLEVKLIGKEKSPFNESHLCFKWQVKIENKGKVEIFDYYTGEGLVTKDGSALVPKKTDVLKIILDDAGMADYSFRDFCHAFGYNEDSIKDRSVYLSILSLASKLKTLFSDVEIDAIRWVLSLQDDE